MSKVEQCKGEGQGSCERCERNGKWNMIWTCFLYRIDGGECLCEECVKEVLAERNEVWK